MRILLGSLLLMLALSACSEERPDLKSPCAGASGAPCDRRPVNAEWPG